MIRQPDIHPGMQPAPIAAPAPAVATAAAAVPPKQTALHAENDHR